MTYSILQKYKKICLRDKKSLKKRNFAKNSSFNDTS